MKIDGERSGLLFHVITKEASARRGICHCCGGPVVKSWRTGILHRYCYGCRYLRMIYGASITVTRR